LYSASFTNKQATSELKLLERRLKILRIARSLWSMYYQLDLTPFSVQ
jgi:hypothetical protein